MIRKKADFLFILSARVNIISHNHVALFLKFRNSKFFITPDKNTAINFFVIFLEIKETFC